MRVFVRTPDNAAMLIAALTIFAAVAPCTDQEMAELMAEGSKEAPDYTLACSAKLSGTDRLTKRLVITDSDVSLDCAGASIQPFEKSGYSIAVRSVRNDDATWSRPERVTVKNCIVYGSIRVYGLGTNGQGEYVRQSSLTEGHTGRAQAAAPRATTFDRITIVGIGRSSPLYLGPGVTETTLTNSEIRGENDGPAVYFDAESAHNTVTKNYIHSTTQGRELFAIDGSAHNFINNNRFSALQNGGIYVYRNCGEGGTVRHQTPKFNEISDNVFYYDEYAGINPSIWLDSRWGFRGYCDEDEGYPFGSSASDLSYAQENIVKGNQIYRLPVIQMIRVTGGPNDVHDNISVNPRAHVGCGGSEEEVQGAVELFRGIPN